MSLRNAVMAALLDGEASGYDLAKAFDASVANFWMCTPQQLYRELDRMEADGLIEARTVEQERRPTKRLFSLTAAGFEALAAFTAEPRKPTAIRDELLVAVMAADSGDVEAVKASIRERKQWAEAKIVRYERLRAKLLGGRTEEEFLTTAERVGPYLTLLRGLSFERDNVRWCARCLTVLERRGARLDAPT
ncbi:PadR family transcriptional regulator [Lentzea sp. PSKA42]|uniref:PadR family transcriptional regulator n=1 Tax=Lentzea indica TaxID=2604800 RepID=A0ABX1FG25_9PSEU|nr:PadR family transcriptional regulator [Lentzea indica]NKE57740.1 PadR family transcriptional regulator [Lentzea indica]